MKLQKENNLHLPLNRQCFLIMMIGFVCSFSRYFLTISDCLTTIIHLDLLMKDPE